jgi:mono/diheme cytochrome c family protein
MTAHEPHVCPDGFPDTPALPGHLSHADIVDGVLPFEQVFEAGRTRFNTVFNLCDGQGRPATTGGGDPRTPEGQPAFIRTSAPDSNACAGCHNQPRSGGGGDFVANVFVLAQVEDPPVVHVLAETITISDDGFVEELHGPSEGMIGSNERNTLGMFGAGPIEMLAREMTAQLQAQARQLSDGAHTLITKGVEFDVTIENGQVVESKGVDTDLIVKPFHQAGVVRSIREFTVNAFNHHHGMQAEERFDLNADKGPDFDADGMSHELTIGDITAATIFQAALGTPGQRLPVDPAQLEAIGRGEQLFAEIGCASCHVPDMRLNSPIFIEPNPLNPSGTFSDESQSFAFDMTQQGVEPRLELTPEGGAIVRAYTDLKRHNLCDDPSDPEPIRFFCNEYRDQNRPAQDGRPGAEFFLTRKLWDVGNSAPYGHRGDLTTLTEAIRVHGGEARAARDHFVALDVADQAAMVQFLKTLQVLPAGSERVVTAP